MYLNRKGIAVRQLFSLETALTVHVKGFKIPKPLQIVKSEKFETFCVSKLLIWS